MSGDEGFDGSQIAVLVGRFRTEKGAPIMRQSKGATVRERLELEDQDIGQDRSAQIRPCPSDEPAGV